MTSSTDGFTHEQSEHLLAIKGTAVTRPGYLSTDQIKHALAIHFGKTTDVLINGTGDITGDRLSEHEGRQQVKIELDGLGPEALISGQLDIDAWEEAYRFVFGKEPLING